MSVPTHHSREAEVSIENIFIDRWSPRSFESTPLSYHDLVKLFEAARWSPSCRNVQPWFFVYATTEADRKRFASILDEKNHQWASQAPLLLYILTSKDITANQRQNDHALFDTGAAWMALAIQAQLLGFSTHCMAGFDREKAHKILDAPEDKFDVVAAVAIGRRGSPKRLPKELAERELPSCRKPLDQVVAEGSLNSHQRGQ